MAKKKKAAAADAAEGEGGKAKGGGKGKLVIILGAVLLLGAAGGGGWFFFLRGKGGDAAKMADGAAATKAPPKKSAFLDLPEMTVNLAQGNNGERQQFLKIRVALEVGEQKIVGDIQPLMPRVMDSFQVFMRELRPADLEGSAGMYRLKEEMVRRVNVAVYPARVDAVLFKELMVQ
jgi:flagellar FliL protein